jgi:transmembrane sensor
MSRRRLYKLLESYKKGTSTPEELALINQWLDKMGEEPLEDTTQFEEKKQTIKEDVWLQLQQPTEAPKKVFHIAPVWRVAAAAAAIGLLLLAGLYFILQKKPATTLALNEPSTKDSLITNNSADAVRYTLSDGSTFTLYAHSAVRISLPWASGTRTLQLKGAALFETAKDHLHPFSVSTKGFVISTLGTVFRVNAYDSMQQGRVKLISGKIVIRGAKENAYLEPGNEYSFDSATGKLLSISTKTKTQEEDIPEEATIEHTDKGIAFHNTPLLQVFKTLSEAYGEEIQTPTGRSFKRKKFTGVVKKDKPLEDVLNTLTDLNELQWERKDSTYLILSK